MNKRLRVLVIAAIVCSVFTPAIFVVQRWANSAATATVTKPTVPGPQTAVASVPLRVQTSYFSTTLPASFSVRSKIETVSAPQIQLRLVAATSSYADQQFAATRGTLPSDGLRGVADYNLRITNTTTYTKFTPPDLPAGAEAFRNVQGPAAITLFWVRNGYFLELAFSTSGGASFDQLQPTYRQVLKSWQWL